MCQNPTWTIGVAVVEQAEAVSAESIAHASAKTEEYEQGSQLRLEEHVEECQEEEDDVGREAKEDAEEPGLKGVSVSVSESRLGVFNMECVHMVSIW